MFPSMFEVILLRGIFSPMHQCFKSCKNSDNIGQFLIRPPLLIEKCVLIGGVASHDEYIELHEYTIIII